MGSGRTSRSPIWRNSIAPYAAGSPAVPALGLAQALTAKAIARGGTDNITVVVVDVDRPDPSPEHHSAEASE